MARRTPRRGLGMLLLPATLLGMPAQDAATEALEGALQTMETMRRVLVEEQATHDRLISRGRALEPGVSREHWSPADTAMVTPHIYFGERPEEPEEYRTEDLLRFLPTALTEDLNRRLYQEYDRGYRDWRAGLMPPPDHLETGFDALRWGRFLFERWDRMESRDGEPHVRAEARLPGLYLSQDPRVGSEGYARYLRELGRLPALRAAATASLEAAEAYRPELRGQRFGWLPLRRDQVWENAAEWSALREAVQDSFQDYRIALERATAARAAALGELVAERLDYRPNPTPRLTLPGRGAPEPPAAPADAGWAAHFDAQVVATLPQRLTQLVRARIVVAYFDGAEAAKYEDGETRRGPPAEVAAYPADAEYRATLWDPQTIRERRDATGPRRPRTWEASGAPPSGPPSRDLPGFDGLFGVEPARPPR